MQSATRGGFSKRSKEVVQHLAAVDGVERVVRVEITAPGFRRSKMRTVSENATDRTFEQSGFDRADV
jgi:hypothetical protein